MLLPSLSLRRTSSVDTVARNRFHHHLSRLFTTSDLRKRENRTPSSGPGPRSPPYEFSDTIRQYANKNLSILNSTVRQQEQMIQDHKRALSSAKYRCDITAIQRHEHAIQTISAALAINTIQARHHAFCRDLRSDQSAEKQHQIALERLRGTLRMPLEKWKLFVHLVFAPRGFVGLEKRFLGLIRFATWISIRSWFFLATLAFAKHH